MKISELLLLRLKSVEGVAKFIGNNSSCKRLRHSREQMIVGAWSWCISHDGVADIGSQFAMKECANSNSLDWLVEGGSIIIYPKGNK